MKKTISLILVTIMMLITLAGCGGEAENTPNTDSNVKTEVTTAPTSAPISTPTPAPTNTPVPTSTPTPTPTPTEVPMPTFEELVNANKDGLENKITSIKFSYCVESPEFGKVSMGMDVTEESYDNISHSYGTVSYGFAGIESSEPTNTYTVDDFDTHLRTEYECQEDGSWLKSTYAYFELEDEESEDALDNPFESLFDAVVTADDNFYYVKGDFKGEDVEGLLDGLGMGDSGMSAFCEMRFNKNDKKIVDITIAFKLGEIKSEEGTVSIDEFAISVKQNTTPIVIPEEVLAAKSEYDVDINIDIDDSDEEDEDALHPQWGKWYNEYKDTYGEFIYYDEVTDRDIPVTLTGQEGWWFDNQYTYSTYVVVEDTSVCTDEPAYEVGYTMSDIKVNTENAERVVAYLLTTDYSQKKTSADIASFICNGKYGYYIVDDSWTYSKEITVLQDIGVGYYLEITIDTSDIKTDALTIIQKFLLNL